MSSTGELTEPLAPNTWCGWAQYVFENMWVNTQNHPDDTGAVPLLRIYMEAWLRTATSTPRLRFQDFPPLDAKYNGLLSDLSVTISTAFGNGWDTQRLIKVLKMQAEQYGVTL